MMFICILLHCGLPIDGMGYFRRKEAPKKEVVSNEIITAKIKDLIAEMQALYFDETSQSRIGLLIQNITPGFYDMQLSKEELEILFDANTKIGSYLRKALLYTVSETQPEKRIAAKYFTDFTQFDPAGRSYYGRYKEGEACAVFDTFLSALVQLRAISLTSAQQTALSAGQKLVLENDFERFLTNISCPLTTSITCFKNHIKQFESDTTILTRFLKAAIIVYASAEIAQSDILQEYNKMSWAQKNLMKFKFWGTSNKPAKVTKDYMYAAMAPLSMLYESKEAWDGYINGTLAPFMSALLVGQLTKTQAMTIVDDIARHAKDPSFLRKNWLRILGGAAVIGFGTILYYDQENLKKAYGAGGVEGWKALFSRAVHAPFEFESYRAAGAGVKTSVSNIPGSGRVSSTYESAKSGLSSLWQKRPGMPKFSRPGWTKWGKQAPVTGTTGTGTTGTGTTGTGTTGTGTVGTTPRTVVEPEIGEVPLTQQQQMERSAETLKTPYSERGFTD